MNQYLLQQFIMAFTGDTYQLCRPGVQTKPEEFAQNILIHIHKIL